MKWLFLVVVFAAAACFDEPLPTCADVQCPDAPSGSADQWTPCDAETCYCRLTDTEIQECRP